MNNNNSVKTNLSQIPLKKWSVNHVYQWLLNLNFQPIAALITRHYIDGISLIQLDINQLIYFGIEQQHIQLQLLTQIQHIVSQDKDNIRNREVRRSGTFKFKQVKHRDNYDSTQQMVVKCKFNMNSYVVLPNQVFIIGTHYENHIRCVQLTVQEHHAEISSMNHHFYIRDLGTKYGTYIKITLPFKLEKNMLFQLGEVLFQILQVSFLSKSCKIKAIYNRKKQQFNFSVNLLAKQYFRIGRRQDNDFSIDDEFLCQLHAKIFVLGGQIMLQDLQSINGTWLRLSKQKTPSQVYKLQNKTIFKIGWCISYECEIKDQGNKKKELKQDMKECYLCCKKDRNILYLPCRHFISCEECSKQSDKCSMCLKTIQSTLKIFTT